MLGARLDDLADVDVEGEERQAGPDNDLPLAPAQRRPELGLVGHLAYGAAVVMNLGDAGATGEGESEVDAGVTPVPAGSANTGEMSPAPAVEGDPPPPSR